MSTILSLLYADNDFTQKSVHENDVLKMIRLQKSIKRRHTLRKSRRKELRNEIKSQTVEDPREYHANSSFHFQEIKFP